MKPEDVKKLNAIREIVGTGKRFTAGALYPKFGNKTAVGHWLRRMQGQIVDGFRLCAERDNHSKQWRYQFKAANAIPGVDELRDAAESEARLKTLNNLEWKMREHTKQLQKIDERAADAKSAAEFAAIQSKNAVTVQAPPKSEPLYETKWTSDGRLIRTPVLDKNGEPVMQPAAPAPAAEPAASKPRYEWADVWPDGITAVGMSKPEPVLSGHRCIRWADYVRECEARQPGRVWKPGCGRPFTHADAIAANQRAANPGGFLDPYGTLAHSDNVRECEASRGWRQTGPSSMSDPNWKQKL